MANDHDRNDARGLEARILSGLATRADLDRIGASLPSSTEAPAPWALEPL